ncbi:anaphase-promoting complex subunit, putative,expressed [Hordeum vulgare]|nr:anaphase-promoting complex subunit, putative,expressed [Hordeum vulgare]
MPLLPPPPRRSTEVANRAQRRRQERSPHSRAPLPGRPGLALGAPNTSRAARQPNTESMESDGEEEAAATPTPGTAAAAPAAGRLKGCPELTVEDVLQEMARTATWSVSSCKPGNSVERRLGAVLHLHQLLRPDHHARPHQGRGRPAGRRGNRGGVAGPEEGKEVFRDTDLSSDSEDDDELKHLKRTIRSWV